MLRRAAAWCIQHPITDGIACGVAFFIVSSLLIGFAFPAWAVSIPITERIVINLGDLPPWIAAIIAFAVYWEARKAKQQAAEAAVASKEAVAVSKDVATKVDGVLADRDKGKVAEGEKKVHDEQSAAKDVASADAVRDAGTAAAIAAVIPSNETR